MKQPNRNTKFLLVALLLAVSQGAKSQVPLQLQNCSWLDSLHVTLAQEVIDREACSSRDSVQLNFSSRQIFKIARRAYWRKYGIWIQKKKCYYFMYRGHIVYIPKLSHIEKGQFVHWGFVIIVDKSSLRFIRLEHYR